MSIFLGFFLREGRCTIPLSLISPRYHYGGLRSEQQSAFDSRLRSELWHSLSDHGERLTIPRLYFRGYHDEVADALGAGNSGVLFSVPSGPKNFDQKVSTKTFSIENSRSKMFRPKRFRSNICRPKTFRPKTFRPKTFRPKHFRPKHFRPKKFRSKHFRSNNFRSKHFRSNNFRSKMFRSKNVRPKNLRSKKVLIETFSIEHFRSKHFRSKVAVCLIFVHIYPQRCGISGRSAVRLSRLG